MDETYLHGTQLIAVIDPATGGKVAVRITSEFARAILDQWENIERGAIHVPPHLRNKVETKDRDSGDEQRD